ncbi:hypothetical protein KIN20_007579 [Parelaphostrongylus tenuis]|uniref:Uncharacterized protein n=1 Tax=Parelaphostrongylus tenuis TaxID=148309 RepID=A0AAD5M5Q0_PARTN|nr:hypothetical protein KIN20_007579 [Parelaphostrongylus tenuis]
MNSLNVSLSGSKTNGITVNLKRRRKLCALPLEKVENADSPLLLKPTSSSRLHWLAIRRKSILRHLHIEQPITSSRPRINTDVALAATSY